MSLDSGGGGGGGMKRPRMKAVFIFDGTTSNMVYFSGNQPFIDLYKSRVDDRPQDPDDPDSSESELSLDNLLTFLYGVAPQFLTMKNTLEPFCGFNAINGNRVELAEFGSFVFAAIDSDRDSDFLHRKLHTLHSIVQWFLGPTLKFSINNVRCLLFPKYSPAHPNAKRDAWNTVSNLLEIWEYMYGTEQQLLVEAHEKLMLNFDFMTKYKELLDGVNRTVQIDNCYPSCSLIFAKSRLFEFKESKDPNKEPLHPSDVLMMTLFLNFLYPSRALRRHMLEVDKRNGRSFPSEEEALKQQRASTGRRPRPRGRSGRPEIHSVYGDIHMVAGGGGGGGSRTERTDTRMETDMLLRRVKSNNNLHRIRTDSSSFDSDPPQPAEEEAPAAVVRRESHSSQQAQRPVSLLLPGTGGSLDSGIPGTPSNRDRAWSSNSNKSLEGTLTQFPDNESRPRMASVRMTLVATAEEEGGSGEKPAADTPKSPAYTEYLAHRLPRQQRVEPQESLSAFAIADTDECGMSAEDGLAVADGVIRYNPLTPALRANLNRDSNATLVCFLNKAGDTRIPTNLFFVKPKIHDVVLVFSTLCKPESLAKDISAMITALENILGDGIIASSVQMYSVQGLKVKFDVVYSIFDDEKSAEAQRLMRAWQACLDAGLEAHLEPVRRNHGERLPSTKGKEELRDALSELQEVLKFWFEYLFLGPCLGQAKVEVNEFRSFCERVSDTFSDRIKTAHGSERKFVEFLETRVSAAKVMLSAFTRHYPGLVHFIHVNRSTNQLTAPRFSLAENKVLQKRIWRMVNDSQRLLQRGVFHAIWKDEELTYSYNLFFEDGHHMDRLHPERVLDEGQLETLFNNRPVGYLSSNVYFLLKLSLFQWRKPNFEAITLYETYCVHLASVPLSVVCRQNRAIADDVWDVVYRRGIPLT